ncbi:MAG: tyrosine-protein phosphatase [Gemmatimonadota bacterium]
MPIVDFHNHLMPGVDDGAQTPAEAIDAIAAFEQDGVAVAIATPHMDGSITNRPAELAARLAELDAGFGALQQCARHAGKLQVERGVELLLDIPEPDLTDARLRLAGGKSFLMEFPYMMVPPHSARVIRSLCATGFTPVIAHPERYHDFGSSIDLAAQWKQNGALLQVNGGSLLGRYGAEARRTAFELLRRGWADYICSDYHARGPTLVAQCRALLESTGGAEQAYILMETNPARLLSGLAPLPVAPLQVRRSLWGRISAVFRP